MPRVLHIITRQNEPLAPEIINCHRAQTDCHIDVVDLTKPEPDYQDLLEKIFAADSVQVW